MNHSQSLISKISQAVLSIFCLGFLLFTNPLLAEAKGNWKIDQFHADITLNSDSSLSITETITADFSQYSQRGIFRYIPIKFSDELGTNKNTNIDLESITSPNGTPYQYQTSREGNDIKYRIGNPEVFLTEPTTYIIKYKISNAILDFNSHDEIYWNVTGSWPVNINNTTATINLPESLKNSKIETICITGLYGSQENNCQIANNQNIVDTKVAQLPSYNQLTIGIKFPKGHISHPSFFQKIFWFIQANLIFSIPFFLAIALTIVWFVNGRDPKESTTIIPHYKPPQNLSPIEIGTLIDEKVDAKDLSATIIDLAIRGFITIKEEKSKNYTLTLNKGYDETLKDKTLKPHESFVIKSIFSGFHLVTTNSLKYKFYKIFTTVKNQVYRDLIEAKYFPHNPENIRSFYQGLSGFIFIGTLMLFQFVMEFLGLAWLVALLGSSLVLFIFSFIMPRKTHKGVKTLQEIKGLEEYILTAEKDRIQFQEKHQLLFEKLLPYAIVFNIADVWAKNFENLYQKPPTWYQGDLSNFSTSDLIYNLNSFSTNSAKAFTAKPRSKSSSWGGGSSFGGGGFSGGGFGGGGGGSW